MKCARKWCFAKILIHGTEKIVDNILIFTDGGNILMPCHNQHVQLQSCSKNGFFHGSALSVLKIWSFTKQNSEFCVLR